MAERDHIETLRGINVTKRIIVALLLITAGPLNVRSQQTYAVFGLGGNTCGDLIKAKEGIAANVPDSAARYTVMLSWVQGFITGAGLERSGYDLIWDSTVFAGLMDSDARDRIKTVRLAYCKATASDPICSIWTGTPVRAMREGGVLKETNSNGLVAWTERYCADHALDKLGSAAGKLLFELQK